VTAAVGYFYIGQYSTAPIIGSLSEPWARKSAFAFVLIPTLIHLLQRRQQVPVQANPRELEARQPVRGPKNQIQERAKDGEICRSES